MEESYLDAISEIIPGFLYLGGANCTTNTAWFAERPACYALNCSEDVPKPSSPVTRYLQIKVSESTTDDLARYWDTATSFIVEAKREGCVVLVYDFSGVSRGPTFVLAYLMMEEKLLFREGLFILKERRRWVNPIMPFCRMLSDLEKRVMGVQSVVVVFQDRETAHLEFPDGVQLPTSDAHGAEGDDDDDRGSGSASDSKHKKKKKKKAKKEKKQGSLRLKVPQAGPKEAVVEAQPKRLKKDKFAWSNEDVYTASTQRDNRRGYK